MMDRLPNELIPKVFSYLEPSDLLTCRVVNQRFRFYADKTRFTELVVADDHIYEQKKVWFLTKNMIDFRRDAIRPNSFNGYRFVFNLRVHLKRLCLCFREELKLDTAILDQMRIEQLDVKCGYLGSHKAIELPELKSLEVVVINESAGLKSFFVRAPKLKNL